MKRITFILALLSLLLLSCSSNDHNLLDLDDVSEALYVIKTEVNHISDREEPQISYLTYINAASQSRVDYKGDQIPTNMFGCQSHILYKHKYHFVIMYEKAIPVMTIENLSYYAYFSPAESKGYNYLFVLLKDVNIIFQKMQKEKLTAYEFRFDSFLISLKLVNGNYQFNFKRYLEDGSVYEGDYTQKSRLKTDIADYQLRCQTLLDSIAKNEAIISEGKKLLSNAELYAKYLKLQKEYNQNKNLVFTTYDRGPYEAIKRKLNEKPEILANAQLYKPENLQKTARKVEQAQKSLQLHKSLLIDYQGLIDGMQSRLEDLVDD